MQDQVYAAESKIEQEHWWFVVRRKLVKFYLKNRDKNSSILDIGSGSGSNLRLLREMGFINYQGFDLSDLAKKFCEEKGLGKVIVGDICKSSIADNSYDIILATDVLEHIEDEKKAIEEIRRILKPQGLAIITVPCFMSLWSDHDETLMHKRRYRIKEISAKIVNAEMKVVESYYFNFFLFIPIFLFRKISKIFGFKPKSETSINNQAINLLLKLLFSFDIFLARKIKFPFGVSAFLLVTK